MAAHVPECKEVGGVVEYKQHDEPTILGACKMKITSALNKKISQAVQTSMQIEGYKPTQSLAIKEQAKALMEKHRVKVSVQRK
jgi:hypothetical protein